MVETEGKQREFSFNHGEWTIFKAQYFISNAITGLVTCSVFL